jgi:hypothetical protein
MRLVGANWLSSRFTFVVCRPSTATCRDKIELQGIGRRSALLSFARGSADRNLDYE